MSTGCAPTSTPASPGARSRTASCSSRAPRYRRSRRRPTACASPRGARRSRSTSGHASSSTPRGRRRSSRGPWARSSRVASTRDRRWSTATSRASSPSTRLRLRRSARFESGPYPEGRAAVHHLLENGWVYVLPFDDGVVSAGIVRRDLLADGRGTSRPTSSGARRSRRRRRSRMRSGRPCRRRASRRARHPPPARSRGGRALGGPAARLCLQRPALLDRHRLEPGRGRASGGDPAASGEGSGEPASTAAAARALPGAAGARGRSSAALVAGAERLYADFDRFVSWSLLYFAAASFCEARQRLVDPPAACWEGFLGTDDAVLGGLFERAGQRLDVGRTRASTPGCARRSSSATSAASPNRESAAGSASISRRSSSAPAGSGSRAEAVRAALPRLRGGGL